MQVVDKSDTIGYLTIPRRASYRVGGWIRIDLIVFFAGNILPINVSNIEPTTILRVKLN